MKFDFYLIFRGLIFGRLIFGGKFVLVIRGAYIRGGLYSGGAYIRDFTVFEDRLLTKGGQTRMITMDSFRVFSGSNIFNNAYKNQLHYQNQNHRNISWITLV